MSAEIWVMFLVLTALFAAAGGYAAARRGAPKRSELEALQRELDAASKQADEVQANVTSHFEQSAVLFGQLARDYRAFLQHFSESARDLGISEARARELLERADRPLLAKSSEIIDADTDVASAPPAEPADPASEPVSASESEAESETVSAAVLRESDAPAAAEVPEPTAAAEIPEATEGGMPPEPPIVDDVVTPGRSMDAAAAAEGTAASRVVDVDLETPASPGSGKHDSSADDSGAAQQATRKQADGG